MTLVIRTTAVKADTIFVLGIDGIASLFPINTFIGGGPSSITPGQEFEVFLQMVDTTGGTGSGFGILSWLLM